jgi:hypothetical protein
MSTGPHGEVVAPGSRVAEILHRYAPDHPVHRALTRSGQSLIDDAGDVAALADRREKDRRSDVRARLECADDPRVQAVKAAAAQHGWRIEDEYLDRCVLVSGPNEVCLRWSLADCAVDYALLHRGVSGQSRSALLTEGSVPAASADEQVALLARCFADNAATGSA